MASHGVLDALTDGGSGVAFLAPFDDTRYFFPWRPIRVSPFWGGFFTPRGLETVTSESRLGVGAARRPGDVGLAGGKTSGN